jgi:outer membrane murein-binding lipoprotein Lpp
MTPPVNTDISNKALSLETIVSFVVLIVAFVFGYGNLSADVGYKADKSDVAVMAAKVDAIADDVAENKSGIKAATKAAQDNHNILIRIEAKLGIHDD